MKPIALVTATVIGSLSPVASAASESDILRARCADQERTIQALEKEIDSLHALLAKNNATPKQMIAKQAPQMTPSHQENYKVVKGDSMCKIARKHGVSLNALLNANKGINPNRLSIGQSISLPSSVAKAEPVSQTPKAIAKAEVLPAPIPPATQPEVPQATSSTRDYVVKKGDTLYGIARKNNTTVANILEQNQGLDPRKLRPGQSIALATTETTSATPSKAPAKQEKTQAIAKQEPKPKPVAKASKPSQQTQKVAHTPKHSKVRTVTVNRQMTFGEFASVYGASVEQINEMNGLKLSKSTVLAQGSELYIPNNQH
ncbi:LysM peptidoglycan-binding domain-containing protein [Rubritalea tangerina]|uniref:LysM peptidoglycan-binding domain-containing protein n=1 Tax=Rubritalea tangerina TaxID=430798 RepID=A0ABW4Z6N9_9BACT